MRGSARGLRFHWSIPGTGAANAVRGAQERATINPVADLESLPHFCAEILPRVRERELLETASPA